MDIPPPSPTAAPSPTAGVGSLAATFNYVSAFQNLSERLDTISLDVQQMCLDHQEDMRTLTGNFHAYCDKQDQRFCELMAQQSEMFQFMRAHFPPLLQQPFLCCFSQFLVGLCFSALRCYCKLCWFILVFSMV